jgi:holo-[acyl-carrier protein] synthase
LTYARPDGIHARQVVHGVGIDLVDVEEIEESLASFGERYIRRVYTTREAGQPWAGRAPRGAVRRLAFLFAVKEATLKALAHDHAGVDWRCIEVSTAGSSVVDVVLSGDLAEVAARNGIVKFVGSVDARRTPVFAVVFALAADCSDPGGGDEPARPAA